MLRDQPTGGQLSLAVSTLCDRITSPTLAHISNPPQPISNRNQPITKKNKFIPFSFHENKIPFKIKCLAGQAIKGSPRFT